MLSLNHLKKCILLGCFVMLTIESLGIPYSNSIHYKWDASLDKTNGIASSIETSSKKLLLHNDEIIKQTSPSLTSPSSSYKTMECHFVFVQLPLAIFPRGWHGLRWQDWGGSCRCPHRRRRQSTPTLWFCTVSCADLQEYD